VKPVQGDIYNDNTPEAERLLSLALGERQALHEGLAAEGFTCTRQANTVIGVQAAKPYVSVQPWEFLEGTKEIRYYLQTEAYLSLLGGYVDTTGSNQEGPIDEVLFNQIVATFRLLR
jgi:hypothetical protein